jgi:hypothetical protein
MSEHPIPPEVIEVAEVANTAYWALENFGRGMEAAIRAADEKRGLRLERGNNLEEAEGWGGSLFVAGKAWERLVSDKWPVEVEADGE